MIRWVATNGIALSVALVLLMVTAIPQVQAEPGRPQQLITDGLELRRAGQDLEALTKFEEAYRLDPSPRAAAQWGLCLQAVGRWSEADAKLAEALKAKTDPWVAKNRATLKDSLEVVKQNVGRIEVYGGPDGATVSVNGRIVGVYPLASPVAVNAGTVDVEVTKEGFKRGYRSVPIAGGQYQRVLIRLDERQQQEVATQTPPPNLDPAPPQPTEGALTDTAATEPQESRPLYKKPWLWVAVGAVVAAGIVGIVLSSGGGGTTGPQVDERGTFGQ